MDLLYYINVMNTKNTQYLNLLDRVLDYAARHTDGDGRMIFNGEIDCKDSGWMVLAGVLRGNLDKYCRLWTLASIRVDDRRSCWTTFALLYALELSKGEFLNIFSAAEQEEFAHFVRQLDMRYLMEASRNYRVAAAVIDVLGRRYGFTGKQAVTPEENIDAMLACYLGQGFFNDDDGRGSGDRRIDAYSAEIIGLLLHYDELYDFQSPRHERIMDVCRDFCVANAPLIDHDGEYAKWGRSLRGEAEVKKICIWEYAEREGLCEPGLGRAAAGRMLKFFEETGINDAGMVGKDKAMNHGIWDEYTTQVQAQGYGAYGLAMAAHYDSGNGKAGTLPIDRGPVNGLLPGPAIIYGGNRKMHYILPLANRMTKNMFFWHNRITGENDVEVDVSAKFMPLPYFGRKMPAPYSGPEIPFLPMVETVDGLLIPRNLNPEIPHAEVLPDGVTGEQRFRFCRVAAYEPVVETEMIARVHAAAESIRYEFSFVGELPENNLVIYFFGGEVEFQEVTPQWEKRTAGASIYGPRTYARVAVIKPCKDFSYTLRWSNE